MLVLTRKVGEGLTIDQNVKVVVLQVNGKQVRLGIQASKDIKIQRDEILERDKMDQDEAISKGGLKIDLPLQSQNVSDVVKF